MLTLYTVLLVKFRLGKIRLGVMFLNSNKIIINNIKIINIVSNIKVIEPVVPL